MSLKVLVLCALAVGVGVSVPLGQVTADVAGAASGQYALRSSVVGSAGLPSSSAAYRSKGTLGQSTPIGIGTASGKTLYAGFWSTPWAVASVPEEDGPEGPGSCLYGNAPNPFSTSTVIAFSVGAEAAIEVTVFNTAGQRVRTLVDEVRPPGRYVTTWDGRDGLGSRVSPGVYFYRLKSASYTSVRKMIVVN
jgi:hypothetical protein